MSGLLDRKATRAFILRMCAKHRPGWAFEKVSEEAVTYIEQRLQALIIKQVQHLPAIGRTVKFP